MFLLILVYMYGLIIPLTADDVAACAQIDSCSCTNSQGVIDLHPLASTSGDPKFKDVPDSTGNYYYSWNPCFPFTEDPSVCSDVMGCETDMTNYFSLGSPDSAKFITDTSKGLILQYTATTEVIRTLKVILKCNESEEGSVDVKGKDSPGSSTYIMTLTSKYCCPHNYTSTTLPPSTATTSTTSTAPSTSTATPMPSTATTSAPSALPTTTAITPSTSTTSTAEPIPVCQYSMMIWSFFYLYLYCRYFPFI